MIDNGMSIQRHFFENVKVGDKFFWYEKRVVHNPYTEWSFSGKSDEVIYGRSKTSVSFKTMGIVPRIGIRAGVWVPICEHDQWLSESKKADRFLELQERISRVLPGTYGMSVLSSATVSRVRDRMMLLKREIAEIEWILDRIQKSGSLKAYVEDHGDLSTTL